MLLKVTDSQAADVRAARTRSKVFAVANFFGAMFSKVVPWGCGPRFLPAYTLKHEGGTGYLQAEPYLEDPRCKLSHEVPEDPSEHIVSETYKFAAFQFFVYKLSDKSIVFPSCTLAGHFWSDISVASVSGQVGGQLDQNDVGKKAWQDSFPKIYGPLLGLAPETLLENDSDTFLRLMRDKGLLKVSGEKTKLSYSSGQVDRKPQRGLTWPPAARRAALGLSHPGGVVVEQKKILDVF